MADVNRGNRPLSPHLSIYRPQITSISSILTRITGNALLLSAMLIVWWFLAAATSEAYYNVANSVLTSWFGDLVMCFSVLGLWYHTLAGVRHLIWDSGRGLDLQTAENMGWIVIIGSVLLTVFTIVVV
ncbi:MAG: succinate dehydrogenase, cytochrome b556 subunit [Aliishimia sp.]